MMMILRYEKLAMMVKMMTKRCRHEIESKPDYPDELFCMKCSTGWYISEAEKCTRKEFLLLPLEVRRIVLKKQAEKFAKENPNYYKDVT